jgi:hypothetical protein
MKKYILILVTLFCLSLLEGCSSAVRTAWTPYRPAYGKAQKKRKLERIRMGTSPLTKGNPTH